MTTAPMFIDQLTVHRIPHAVSGGIWIGYARFQTPNGPFTVQEMVAENQIARQMFPDQFYQVGGIFSGLTKFAKKTVKKIARIKIVRKLAEGVKKAGLAIKKVVESPITAAIVTAVAAALPAGLGTPVLAYYGAIRGALLLIDKLSKGDPGAKAQLADLASQAAEGIPEAQKALKEIKLAADHLDKTGQSAEQAIALAKSAVQSVSGRMPRPRICIDPA